MHGQFNATFAVTERPKKRFEVSTKRWIDWILDISREPVIKLSRKIGVPIVPAETMEKLRDLWSCKNGQGPSIFVLDCLDTINSSAESTTASRGTCASAADLVNAGVEFWEGFNIEMAFACWGAVLELPLSDQVPSEAEILDVATQNFRAALNKRQKISRLYEK
jgi:hypothetical protein